MRRVDREPFAQFVSLASRPPSHDMIRRELRRLPEDWRARLRTIYRAWSPVARQRFDQHRAREALKPGATEETALLAAGLIVSATMHAASGVPVPSRRWRDLLRQVFSNECHVQ